VAKAEKGVTRREVRSVSARGDGLPPRTDEVVVEEPLEIRVAGEPLAITMRTPGADSDLALGFLFAEGIIASAADVGTVAHCGRPGEEGWGNVIDVSPGPGVVLDPGRLESSRRGTLTTAACGVCGRRSIDDLLSRLGPVSPGPTLDLRVVASSTERLRAEQPTFERTGGIHAAALMGADGALLAVAEDVGRHNAVDKVVGQRLRAARPGADGPGAGAALLIVSGRVSFEIVQKAAAARVPMIAAVSAPTSLAIDLSLELGITLAGFVRDGRLNVYTHPTRISGVVHRSDG